MFSNTVIDLYISFGDKQEYVYTLSDGRKATLTPMDNLILVYSTFDIPRTRYYFLYNINEFRQNLTRNQ